MKDSFYIQDGRILASNNFITYQFFIYYLVLGLFFFGHFRKIYRIAIEYNRFSAKALFMGAFLVGILSNLMILLGINSLIPGFNTIFSAIGWSCISISFLKNPMLAYMVSDKLNFILVYDPKSATGIFDYNVVHNGNKEDDLFTDFVYAIRTGLSNLIGKNNLKEMRFDNASISIKKGGNSQYIFIMGSSDNSRILLKSFKHFISDFESLIKEKNGKKTNASTLSIINMMKANFKYLSILSEV